MLLLTRRISEAIIINNNIKLTVLGVQGNQVRLGIDAPISIPVHREEIHEKIVRERDATYALYKPLEEKIEENNNEK